MIFIFSSRLCEIQKKLKILKNRRTKSNLRFVKDLGNFMFIPMSLLSAGCSGAAIWLFGCHFRFRLVRHRRMENEKKSVWRWSSRRIYVVWRFDCDGVRKYLRLAASTSLASHRTRHVCVSDIYVTCSCLTTYIDVYKPLLTQWWSNYIGDYYHNPFGENKQGTRNMIRAFINKFHRRQKLIASHYTFSWKFIFPSFPR